MLMEIGFSEIFDSKNVDVNIFQFSRGRESELRKSKFKNVPNF